MLDKIFCNIKKIILDENSCEVYYKITIPKDDFTEEAMNFTNVTMRVLGAEEAYDKIGQEIPENIGNTDLILTFDDDNFYISRETSVEIHQKQVVSYVSQRNFLGIFLCATLDKDYILEKYGVNYQYDEEDKKNIVDNSDKIKVFAKDKHGNKLFFDSRVIDKTSLGKINKITYNTTSEIYSRKGDIIKDIRAFKYKTHINSPKEYEPSYLSELFSAINEKRENHCFCVYNLKGHITEQSDYNALYRKNYNIIQEPTIKEIKIFRRRTGDWDYKNKLSLVAYYNPSTPFANVKIYEGSEKGKYVIHFIDKEVIRKTVGLYQYSIEIILEDHIRKMVMQDIENLSIYKKYFYDLYAESNRRQNYIFEYNHFTNKYRSELQEKYSTIDDNLQDIKATLTKYVVSDQEKDNISGVINFCKQCLGVDEGNGIASFSKATPETFLYNFQVIEDLICNLSSAYGIVLNKNPVFTSKASGKFVNNIMVYNKEFRNVTDIDNLHYNTSLEYLSIAKNGSIQSNVLKNVIDGQYDNLLDGPGGIPQVEGGVSVTADGAHVGAQKYTLKGVEAMDSEALDKANKTSPPKTLPLQDALALSLALKKAATSKNSPSSNSGRGSGDLRQGVEETIQKKFNMTVQNKQGKKEEYAKQTPEEVISSQSEKSALSSTDTSAVSYGEIIKDTEDNGEYIKTNLLTIKVVAADEAKDKGLKEMADAAQVAEEINKEVVWANVMQIYYYDVHSGTWKPMLYKYFEQFPKGAYIMKLQNKDVNKVNKYNEYFVMRVV